MNRKLNNIVVVGATSGIAQAICRLLAEHHCRLFLVARDAEKLGSVAADLTVRGAVIAGIFQADLSDTGTHAEMLASAWQQLGTVDAAIIRHDLSTEQHDAGTVGRRVAITEGRI